MMTDKSINRHLGLKNIGTIWLGIFLIIGIALFTLLTTEKAAALPYYSYVSLYTNADSSSGAAGSYYSDDGPGVSSVSWPPPMGMGPNAGAGAGKAWADPENGTIKVKAEGVQNNSSGDPIVIGGIQTPTYVGGADAFGYTRSSWEVVSDGTLQPGDPVSLDLSLSIEGSFAGNPSTEGPACIRAALLLNKIDDVWWLDGGLYGDYQFNFGGIDDGLIFPTFDYMTTNLAGPNVNITLPTGSSGLPIFPDAEIPTSSVGDVLVMETLFDAYAYLKNDGYGGNIEADFYNTLQSSLTVTTTGASLVPYGGPTTAPIPEPSSFLLLGGGLGCLLIWRRKRRSAA